MNTPVNLNDYVKLAENCMNKDAWDYVAGAAEAEQTKRDNQTAFAEVKLIPRIFNDVSKRNLKTCVLGHKIDLPVMLAPTSPLRLIHEEAELAQVRAAKNKNTVAICSTDTHYSLEDIADNGNDSLWFQLYPYGDREATENILQRVKLAGYKALVITADAFYAARRERMIRSQFVLPSHIEMGNLIKLSKNKKYRREDGSIKRFALKWSDLDWIASVSGLPIIIKGIMHPDDARRAIDWGAKALVVSNHGGRQLDQTGSTLSQLSTICDLSKNTEIYVDGGIYRGTDVIKAMAIGAKAVLIGRAYIYGLAVNGQNGIEHVLDILHDEIDNALCQLGVSDINQLDRSFVTTNQFTF